jgi:hypothetical protein
MQVKLLVVKGKGRAGWAVGDLILGLFRCTPKVKFFHSLSIVSIFRPMHEVVNVYKKITNYTV